MYQCLLFSTVFLVFVFLDVPTVVKTAETKDDEPNLKADSAFSEVIKNITRVNNVLQELIKNYEKLQKIYHSQESIEQHDYDEEENSSRYGNVKRSKDIPTPGKPKDFPATNIPYSEGESEGSPEKKNNDNKISKDKSNEGRVPSVEALKNDNSIDKDKQKSKKAKTTNAKDAKPQVPIVATYTSGELTHEILDKDNKKPKEAQDVDEHEEIKKQKQTHENLEVEQKAHLEHGSEERVNVNVSNVKSEHPTDVAKVTENKLPSVIGAKKYDEGRVDAADSENEVQYERRKRLDDKRLDDNDKVFHRFATETKNSKEKPAPNLKSRYVQKPKKLTSDVSSVRSSNQTKEKKTLSGRGETEKVARKKTSQKEQSSKKRSQKDVKEIPKKRTQKEDSPKDTSQTEGSKKKKPETGGSSEDEKSIKKEQFKTSILRKAYGDACLKVVVKKCYKACKSTLKHGCRKYKCKSNFQLQFKEHSKTGCIRQFREPPASNATTVVPFEPDKHGALKTVNDKPKVKARETDKNTDGFSDLTRNGYLAAACLPKTRRTDAVPGSSASGHQLNILRDRFERECQKVSCDKCSKACAYAVEQTCSTHNCVPEKKKGLKKICSSECKDSYRANPKKKKNKSSRSSGSESGSGSGSGGSASSGSGSRSGSDTEESYSKSKETKKTSEATTTTAALETNTPPTTKKDETMRLRASDKNQDETRVRLRVVDSKS